VSGDEVEDIARGEAGGGGGGGVVQESFGEAPGEDGASCGDFAEDFGDAEFLGGVDVGERASGVEDFTDESGGAADHGCPFIMDARAARKGGT
jgi:hypothetical protein